MENIDKNFLGISYAKFELALKGINTFDAEKSFQISLLTKSLKKIIVTTAIMTNHKTTKNEVDYNYNFWEHKIPQGEYDFLICTCFEDIEGKISPNGWFAFPKKLLEDLGSKNTISIFESDITGNYTKEPKINKHHFFKNSEIIETN